MKIHCDLNHLEKNEYYGQYERVQTTDCSLPSTRDRNTPFVLNTSFVRCAILSKFRSGPVFHMLNLRKFRMISGIVL